MALFGAPNTKDRKIEGDETDSRGSPMSISITSSEDADDIFGTPDGCKVSTRSDEAIIDDEDEDDLEDETLEKKGSKLSTSAPIKIPRPLLTHFTLHYAREKLKGMGFASPGSSLPKESMSVIDRFFDGVRQKAIRPGQ